MTDPILPEADVAEQRRAVVPDPDDPTAVAGQVREVLSVPEAEDADVADQLADIDQETDDPGPTRR